MRAGHIQAYLLGALVVFGGPAAGFGQSTAPGFVGGAYRADQAFPEFMSLWREGWKLFDEAGNRLRYATENMPLGGYLHVYVQNPGSAEVEVEDVLLNGVSLKDGVAPEGMPKEKEGKYASSVQFSKLPAEQIGTLRALGEPVWWKVNPFTIEPNGFAEVVVRLRRPPQVGKIAVQVTGKGLNIQGEAVLDKVQPRLVSVGFNPKMDSACLYVRHPQPGLVPAKVLMDGQNVTDGGSMAADATSGLSLAVVSLKQPVHEGEFHLFHVYYPDESVAIAGLRVHRPDFVYGMWGYPRKSSNPDENIANYLNELAVHGIDTIMFHYGGEVRNYVRSEAGQAQCAKLGIEIMDHSPRGYKNQRYNFLRDEPDASDHNTKAIPELDRRVGSLAQWLVNMGRGYRQQDPGTLQMLNIDNTFKPVQWYTSAQLPDVACADPYYPEQLRSVYYKDPGSLKEYMKPTYVYAVGSIYGSACAPRPMHLILHTCRFDMQDGPFRAPTPEEKRVEIYYALAAGGRGISFWWYTPGGRFNGVGGDAPELKRLYNEIGLLGAEIRMLEPILGRACPVQLAVQGPRTLWVRSLAASTDTVVLIVVNDNIACDRVGTLVQPFEKARLNVKLPGWAKAEEVFEVTFEGTKDVSWKPGEAGISLDLGRVNLTRLLVVTADAQLREQLQDCYDASIADNVRLLLAEKEALVKEAQK